MWKTPLKSEREVQPGVDFNRKRLGRSWIYRQYCFFFWFFFVLPSRELTSRGQCLIMEGLLGLGPSHLRRFLREVEWGLDFHLFSPKPAKCKQLHKDGSIFTRSLSHWLQELDTPNHHHTSKEAHIIKRTSDKPHFSSVLFFILSLFKAFSSNKSYVDFELWLAISKVQS